MKIVSIFDSSKHTLLAIQYDGEEEDEYTKAFNNWSDVSYLRNFFKEHEKDLLHGYYQCSNINAAITETMALAQKLEDLIYDKAYGGATQKENMLQSLFKPLNNNDTQIYDLQKSKYNHSWLRIYAIRIAPNCYIVTGSAIKLVRNMDEKDYLIKEKQKLEKVKNFLIDEGLTDEDSFDFIELNGK
jgi:hypothetical protein